MNKRNVFLLLSQQKMSSLEAANRLKISRRHCFRLLACFRKDPASIEPKPRIITGVEKRRKALQKRVLLLYREKYAGFGPTLATEYLNARDGIKVPICTLRRWLIAEGIWKNKAFPPIKIHWSRPPRERFGELIQIDGSLHNWFGDDRPKCTLLCFVDDATSKIVKARFFKTETAENYWAITKEYVLEYGKPGAFYSDKHSTFRINREVISKLGDNLTQFGRAMKNLGIEIICANTPQAKGRVERKFRLLQDRLVKALVFDSVRDIDSANDFLPVFLKTLEKFERAPASRENAHRNLTQEDNLDSAFYKDEIRKVSSALTFPYKRKFYVLKDEARSRVMRHKQVVVREYSGGRVEILFNGKNLPFEIMWKGRATSPSRIVDPKHLDAALSHLNCFAAEQVLGIGTEQRKTAQGGTK